MKYLRILICFIRYLTSITKRYCRLSLSKIVSFIFNFKNWNFIISLSTTFIIADHIIYQSVESSKALTQTTLSKSVDQLSSKNAAIVTNAIRNIYEISQYHFLTDSKIEPYKLLSQIKVILSYAFGSNYGSTLFYENSNQIFVEFGNSFVGETSNDSLVASVYIKTAAQWFKRDKNINLFHDIKMPKANLRGIDLTDIFFSNSTLNETRFSACQMNNSKFINVLLSSAISENGSNWNKTIFNNVTANNMLFRSSNISEARFIGSTFHESSFEDTDMSYTYFSSNTNLQKTKFIDTKMNSSVFSDVVLDESKFQDVDLSNAQFIDIYNMDNVRFENSNLTKVKFQNVDLKNVLFDSKTNISYANFTYAKNVNINKLKTLKGFNTAILPKIELNK